MFAIEYLLEKACKKSISTIANLKKSIFNQVIDRAKPYMLGKGIDLGCGFQTYEPDFDITKIDINPLVNPDKIANFLSPTFTVGEKIDYAICSYVVNTKEDLIDTIKKTNDMLTIGGHLILFIGDKTIIDKGQKENILPPYLMDYLKSNLTYEIIQEQLKLFSNMEVVEVDLPKMNEKNDEPLKIFETRYGIFIVLRKNHEIKNDKQNEYEESPQEIRA